MVQEELENLEFKPVDEAEARSWAKVVYGKAWDQYTLEDTMVQNRNSMFLIVITFFMTTAVTIVVFLLSKLEVGHVDKNIKILLSGFVIVLFNILVLPILKYWRGVTATSREMIHLRFKTALKIEKKYYPSEVGLASDEHDTYDKRSKEYIGAFLATYSLIKIIKKIALILIVLGVVLVVSALALYI